jgi:hypothetical protein
MWTFLKTKRITILALLAGLAYAFMFFNSFASEWDDWQLSFNQKSLSAKYNKWGDVIGYNPVEMESYRFSVEPIKGFASFPDSLVNLATNQVIKAKYREMIVIGPATKTPTSSKIQNVFIVILAFLMLVASIGIPIHFYKLIGLLQKGFIFERKSIHLLRWLGFQLLFIYLAGILFLYLEHQISCSLFRFSDYEIAMGKMDPIWLFLGIVVLLLAEVFSKALSLKEDQELTI